MRNGWLSQLTFHLVVGNTLLNSTNIFVEIRTLTEKEKEGEEGTRSADSRHVLEVTKDKRFVDVETACDDIFGVFVR